MCSLPVLSYPDESKDAGEFVLTCDASQLAIGGTFSQINKETGAQQLISAFGRSLHPHETRYHCNELEVLSIIVGIQKFKHLIFGKKLLILTDNITARYLKSLSTASSSRLQRWSVYLSDVIHSDLVTFKHIAGQSNKVADVISRFDYSKQAPEPPSEKELEVTGDDMYFVALDSTSDVEDSYFDALAVDDEFDCLLAYNTYLRNS